MKHTGGKWRGRLSALLLLAGGAARAVCGAPMLQLETAYIDAGCHPAHDHFTQTIQLLNAGDETLVLESPTGDCRCVIPVLEEEFVEPGASTVLCLDVDTEDSTGRIIRRVRIRSNDPERPEVAVILDYRVQVPFRVSPPVVELGVVRPGVRRSCSFKVNPCTASVLDCQEVVAETPHVRVLDYGPPETMGGPFVVHAEFTAPDESGSLLERLKVRTSSAEPGALFLHVRAAVSRDVQCSAEVLDFGTWATRGPVERSVQVTAQPGTHVMGARSTNRHVEASWQALDGARWLVTARTRPSLACGPLRGEVIVTTGGGENLEIYLPLRGCLQEPSLAMDDRWCAAADTRE